MTNRFTSGGGGSFWLGPTEFLYKHKGGGGGQQRTKMAAGGNVTFTNIFSFILIIFT